MNVWAGNGSEENRAFRRNPTKEYLNQLYTQFHFGKSNRISFDAFEEACIGYANLIETGLLREGALLSICDLSLSSNLPRFWVLDVNSRKVLFNTLMAHGMNSGEEYATSFSNIPESHQSSLGFYLTAETYQGTNGYSLKLNGIDEGYNDKAAERAIVMHGASYVSTEFARSNQRIGRSHGCPALPVEYSDKIISKLQEGHCLFIYYPDRHYQAQSYWLNRVPEKSLLTLVNRSDEGSAECSKENAFCEEPVLLKKPRGTVTTITVLQENRHGEITDTLRVH